MSLVQAMRAKEAGQLTEAEMASDDLPERRPPGPDALDQGLAEWREEQRLQAREMRVLLERKMAQTDPVSQRRYRLHQAHQQLMENEND